MAPNSPTPSNDVTAQLRDLERQGGGMARLAHVSAGALLVVFSAGSLLSLSFAALQHVMAGWSHGAIDVPNVINICVNLLLVLSMDVAMLYAASVLRTLTAAQAPLSEQRVHRWVMFAAALLEGATYLYMAWQFDRPGNLWLWLIAIGRAGCAPLFATYLSMARPLPVAPRDIAYYTSLFSGKGLVRDVAELAADSSAPLERKVRIYSASANMSHADRTKFDGIIEAVSESPEQPTWPTNGGTPLLGPVVEPITQPSLPVVRLDADDSGEHEQPAAMQAQASSDSQPLGKRQRWTEEQRQALAFGLMLQDETLRKNANALRQALRNAGVGCRWETAQAYQVRFNAQQRRIGPVAQ